LVVVFWEVKTTNVLLKNILTTADRQKLPQNWPKTNEHETRHLFYKEDTQPIKIINNIFMIFLFFWLFENWCL